MIDIYEFHIFELWDKEINATQKIIPVKYATYIFVKRNLKNSGLPGFEPRLL